MAKERVQGFYDHADQDALQKDQERIETRLTFWLGYELKDQYPHHALKANVCPICGEMEITEAEELKDNGGQSVITLEKQVPCAMCKLFAQRAPEFFNFMKTVMMNHLWRCHGGIY